jgi:hypothetical protein
MWSSRINMQGSEYLVDSDEVYPNAIFQASDAGVVQDNTSSIEHVSLRRLRRGCRNGMKKGLDPRAPSRSRT